LDFFQAIAEIINSEKSYLSQLEIVEEFFMKPIQESGFLPQQVFAAIFGDILGIRYSKSIYLGVIQSIVEELISNRYFIQLRQK
jgi:hypothetical protein